MTGWNRLGRVFVPDGSRPWMRTHASLPTPMHLEGTTFRVFFAGRDEDQRSHVGAVDVDVEDPGHAKLVSDDPILAPGPVGHFDAHGVYPSSIVKLDDEVRLYGMGWVRGEPPVFYPSIGLAISHDGGDTFEKWSASPILARGPYDPWMVTSPYVVQEPDAWHMWYVSGIGWDHRGDRYTSFYHIREAVSKDGISWTTLDPPALPLQGDETNLVRPQVRETEYGHLMWFGRACAGPYAIGCASSKDRKTWSRLGPEHGLEPQGDDWESEAVACPGIVEVGGSRYMFYNGNGYGRTGFGLAVWES